MTSHGDLIETMRKVGKKDPEAFSELYRATSAKLYGIILRILKRRDLADEVLQEVYVKIWNRADQFDATRAAPITWLATIARNRALDELRRKQHASIEDHPEVPELSSNEDSALVTLMRVQAGEQLSQCLAELPPDRRDMVILAYCEGFSREELAARYTQPVNTVKTWLRRALAQLKGCLGA